MWKINTDQKRCCFILLPVFLEAAWRTMKQNLKDAPSSENVAVVTNLSQYLSVSLLRFFHHLTSPLCIYSKYVDLSPGDVDPSVQQRHSVNILLPLRAESAEGFT